MVIKLPLSKKFHCPATFSELWQTFWQQSLKSFEQNSPTKVSVFNDIYQNENTKMLSFMECF